MQGVLITIASAVILAIVAAFAAPFVVDWTAWRGAFESQASRSLGVPVVIRGNIYADILPTPRVILRNVSIGADAISTGAVVDELRADLSLGALVRGSVEAKTLTLVRPRMRLVLDSAGRVALPTGAAAPGGISISQLAIESGTLDLLDRGADRTVRFTDLDLRGEARSLAGPFRLEGEVETEGRRFGTRLSLAAFGADGSRMRLIAEDRSRPITLDLDGTLRLDSGAPRFDGRGSLARRPDAAAAAPATANAGGSADAGQQGVGQDSWRLSGALRASPEAVVVETLDLSLADTARPVQLAGSARLALGRTPGLDVVLNARAVDADALRASPAAPQTAADSLAALMAAFDALPAPQVPARIGVAVEQLTYAGTVLRDARLDLSGADGGWRIDAAEAKLPGQSALRLSGMPGRANGSGFTGDLAFSSDDPAAFLRWAAPRATADFATAVVGPVKLVGRVTAGAGRFGVQKLDASFGAATVSGSGQFTDGDRARLDLSLRLDGLDLDPALGALRQGLAMAGEAVDGGVALEGRRLKVGGLSLGALSLAAEGAGGTWTLSRLAVDDLAGLHLEGKGSLTRLAPLQGRLELTVAGAKADGLVPLARLISGERAGEVMTRLLPVAAPVNLTGSATWRDGGAGAVRLDGTLGLLAGHAAFAPGAAGGVPRVDLTLSASDGARVLEAAGLSGLRPGLGTGQFTLALAPSGAAEATLDGRLVLADTVATAKGPVKVAADGTLQPRLAMRLDGADVAKLFLAAAPAAEDGPVPAALGFTLSRAGGAWQLDELKGLLGGAPLSGAVAIEGGEVPRLTGRLDLDTLSLPRLLGMWGARSIGSEVGNGPWSAARFTPAPAAPVALMLDLTTRRLDLNGTYALQGAKGRLQARDATLDLRDLSGSIGGGTLSGNLTLRRRPDMVAAEGHLGLDGVDFAALFQPLSPRAPPAGRLSLSVDMGGVGRSPLALVQSLSGQGTLGVQALEIPGADPRAIESVLADTATGAPPDERRVVQMFDRALARGPLKLSALDSTVSLVNGVVRLSTARAQADGARATFSGTLDLPRLYLDGTLDLEAAEAGGAVPGGSISWRGPIAAPERRVAAPALVAAISMRAIERETRRLEERQGLVPAPSAGSGTAPAAAPAPTPISTAPSAPASTAPAAAPQVQPAPAPVQSAPAPSAPAQSPASPPAAARETSEPTNGEESRTRAPARSTAPRQASERSRSAAPPLAPPIEIGPMSRARPARPSLPPEGGSFAPPTPGFGNLPRPPALVPGE
ncbi:AsmA-like C-terminal region-containing protein [Xanthobacter sp. VNH20]|uniref:AsmA family protein n=1 Tax=Xanthobacter sp. VNH20 TaxID=3156616 RepID=UPI0032B4683A